MASMFGKIETVMTKMVEQPLSKTHAALDRLAARDSGNPGPFIAKALLSGFASYDPKDSLKFLARAKRLLDRQRDAIETDEEMALAKALYDVIDAESQMRIKAVKRKGTTRQRVALEQKSRGALKTMQRLSRRMRGQGADLAMTLTAMLTAVSQATSVHSRHYRSAMRAMSRMRRRDSRVRHLAGFFELYGHRRARNYRGAVRIGKWLESELPNSAMVKRTIASCYYFQGDMRRAEPYYKQALTLSRNDPSVMLDYSRMLAVRGDAEEAEALIRRARSLGAARKLKPSLRSSLHMLNVAKVGAHRFERL